MSNSDLLHLKIKGMIKECDKHLLRLDQGYNEVAHLLPISASAYMELSDEHIRAIDQYLYRFAKLQDSMGEKLFRFIIEKYDLETNLPFVDMLNRLEKLGFLPNAREWLILRKIRNEIAHQYDSEPEEMSQAISSMLNQKKIIEEIYLHTKAKLESVLV